MQITQKSIFYKRIITNIDNHNPKAYLLSAQVRQNLGFPEQSLLYDDPANCSGHFLSLSYNFVQTTQSQQIIQFYLIDQNQTILIDQFIKTQGKILNYSYLTFTTGINQKKYQQSNFRSLKDIFPIFFNFIKGNILIGYNLSQFLRSFPTLAHPYFIDIVDLYHYKPPPYLPSLKNLAYQYLKIPIQYGFNKPSQNSMAALRLAKFHIQNGRGRVQYIKTQRKLCLNIQLICQQTGLDKKKIKALFLRGSRATGNATQDSDYDYIMVYDTNALINGGLITLFLVDIAFYDTKSFKKLIQQTNDISIIEVFYLQKNYQIHNQFNIPKISQINLRQSCSYHVHKSLKKSKINFNEKKFLKSLKSIYLAYRFYDNYDQIITKGGIFQYRRTLFIWKQMEKKYREAQNDVECLSRLYQQYLKFIQNFAVKFRQKYPTIKRNSEKKQQKNRLQFKKVQFQNLKKNQTIKQNSIFPLNKPQKEASQIKKSQSFLLCQDYLKNGSLQSLCQNYNINFNRHYIFSNLIQLSYSNSANFKNNITRQCRGVILDQDNSYKIVALPYLKFFDYNDPKFSQVKFFDWQNQFQIYQKYDGSIATMYYYQNQWHVASSHKPDGQGSFCFGTSLKTNFNKQFWRIFYLNNYKLPSVNHNKVCFVFQLLSKNHMIIVNIKNDRLILHGARNLVDLKQIRQLDLFQKQYCYQIAKPLSLKIKSIQDIVSIAQKLDPREQQGFILKDRKDLRIKVKSSNYLRASYLSQFLNPNNTHSMNRKFLLNIIIQNEHQTFKVYCPQWTVTLNILLDSIQKLKNYIMTRYKNIYTYIQNQKEFARQICKNQKESLHCLYYMIRKNQLSEENFIRKIQPKRLLYLIQNPEWQM